jgi:hypothetical protein
MIMGMTLQVSASGETWIHRSAWSGTLVADFSTEGLSILYPLLCF